MTETPLGSKAFKLVSKACKAIATPSHKNIAFEKKFNSKVFKSILRLVET